MMNFAKAKKALEAMCNELDQRLSRIEQNQATISQQIAQIR